jgi:hypothetical protein
MILWSINTGIYKYINTINKANQKTANVQAISIIISKLSKIMSN